MNRSGLLRGICALAAFAGTLAYFPSWWCGRDSSAWYTGDLSHQIRLARTVEAQTQRDLQTSDYHTGNEQFAGEWLFGTYVMAGIGFCQLVQEHPETASELIPQIEQCIQILLSTKVRAFDGHSWHEDALATLAGDRGHAAYLGYLNLLLGLYREVNPRNPFVALNDQISETLDRRMSASSNGLIETYPGEWYPVDNSPVLASLALHTRAANRGDSIARLTRNYCLHAIDPATGLLFQALGENGRPVDQPRGSGSTLAAFYLGHGVPALAREIFAAVRRQLAVNVLGFGAMREYPRGAAGPGDIDSGPIIFGFGFSATGFSIGGARMCEDQELFHRLFASANFAGAPIHPSGRTEFVTAGPLGNAILLAMLTAPHLAAP